MVWGHVAGDRVCAQVERSVIELLSYRPPNDIYRHHYSSNDGIRSALIKHYWWTAVCMTPTELGGFVSHSWLFRLSSRKLNSGQEQTLEKDPGLIGSLSISCRTKQTFHFLLLCPCHPFAQVNKIHKADARRIISAAKSLFHVNAQSDRMSASVTTDFLQQTFCNIENDWTNVRDIFNGLREHKRFNILKSGIRT